MNDNILSSVAMKFLQLWFNITVFCTSCNNTKALGEKKGCVIFIFSSPSSRNVCKILPNSSEVLYLENVTKRDFILSSNLWNGKVIVSYHPFCAGHQQAPLATTGVVEFPTRNCSQPHAFCLLLAYKTCTCIYINATKCRYFGVLQLSGKRETEKLNLECSKSVISFLKEKGQLRGHFSSYKRHFHCNVKQVTVLFKWDTETMTRPKLPNRICCEHSELTLRPWQLQLSAGFQIIWWNRSQINMFSPEVYAIWFARSGLWYIK